MLYLSYVFKLSAKNFSNGRTISEYLVRWGGWSVTSNLGCFFIWSAEYIEETAFGKLIICLLNKIGNPLRCNNPVRVKIKSVCQIVT